MSQQSQFKSCIPLAGFSDVFKKPEAGKQAVSSNTENIELQPLKTKPELSEKNREIRQYLLGECKVVRPGDETEEVVGHERVLSVITKAFMLKAENVSNDAALSALLLAGIPGTGKSTILKAAAGIVANILDTPVSTWTVSASTILSKYQGESEASLKMVYKLASENGPSIILVDEVDGLMGGTGRGNEDELARRFKTEFLQILQGTTEYSNIVTLGCTNRPWLLDDNFLRRFQLKFRIGLPNGEQRVLILAKAFKLKAGITYSKLGFADEDVIRETKGFTGDQIFRAVIAVVLHLATFQKDGKNVPDNEILKNCKGNSTKVGLHLGNITWDIFLKHGINKISNSIDLKKLRKLDKWSADEMAEYSGNELNDDSQKIGVKTKKKCGCLPKCKFSWVFKLCRTCQLCCNQL